MDLSTPRPRINGAMFSDFQSKSVTVLGIATEVFAGVLHCTGIGGGGKEMRGRPGMMKIVKLRKRN